MYGFCCEEFLGVRYNHTYSRQVSSVPMVDPVAAARANQPDLSTTQLHSLKVSRWHSPNVAYSDWRWHSGRLS